jgi:hypothetical protein
LFIKSVFLEFYTKTIQEWWPNPNSRGQESSQGRGSCQDPNQATNGEQNRGAITEVARELSVTPRVSKPHDYANHMFMRL